MIRCHPDFIPELAFALEKDGQIVGNIMCISSTAADCCEDTAAVASFDATFPPKEKA